MKRDLTKLQQQHFDVLIIGGGIYGAFTAWDAAQRGLKVALIERSDFGSATSSNSLKIIHGGLRYLQHADFKRMRESITERTNLMRIAPHLVHPLPCIMPTYGHALKGREVMSVALFLNDLIGYDRNRLPDPQKRLPRGGIISKSECLRLIPGIPEDDLTGGAIWYDCQVHNSERLLLSALHSAANSGAVLANYVSMSSLRLEGNSVTGVVAHDEFDGGAFEISSDLVVNCAGPWFNDILKQLNGKAPKINYPLSAAMNLVVRKKLFDKYAVGLSSRSEFRDEDALLQKGSRLFFVTPWRDCSLIGTTHVNYEGTPDDFSVREEDLETFLEEINQAYPPAKLKREDVLFSYAGLLPAEEQQTDGDDVKLLKQYQIIDHKSQGGIDGLLTVVSVKYTTSRDVAEKAVDAAMKKLGRPGRKSKTSSLPVFGGDIDNFDNYLKKEAARAFVGLDEATLNHLIANYGSSYSEMVEVASQRPDLLQPVIDGAPVLRAEIIYAVRNEMALHLVDVIRRRTILGSAGYPGDIALSACAEIMAEELGWTQQTIEDEIRSAEALYQVSSESRAEAALN